VQHADLPTFNRQGTHTWWWAACHPQLSQPQQVTEQAHLGGTGLSAPTSLKLLCLWQLTLVIWQPRVAPASPPRPPAMPLCHTWHSGQAWTQGLLFYITCPSWSFLVAVSHSQYQVVCQDMPWVPDPPDNQSLDSSNSSSTSTTIPHWAYVDSMFMPHASGYRYIV
jgi:hypothetical protein